MGNHSLKAPLSLSPHSFPLSVCKSTAAAQELRLKAVGARKEPSGDLGVWVMEDGISVHLSVPGPWPLLPPALLSLPAQLCALSSSGPSFTKEVCRMIARKPPPRQSRVDVMC